MTSKPLSYRNSHTAPRKGVAYDTGYASDPGSRLYWSLEQEILADFLDTHFRGRQVRLLDFACGTGRVTGFLEDRVSSAVGVDVSPSMLGVARRKLRRTELIQADLTQQNVLAGRRFDLITAFRFFVNAEPALRRQVMAILAPLLADDGYLVFNNHQNRTAPWSLYGQIRNRGECFRWRYNVMSMQEMRTLAAGAGLRVAEWFHLGLVAPRLVGLFPASWPPAIERVAMKLPFLAPLSEEVIAACRHARG